MVFQKEFQQIYMFLNTVRLKRWENYLGIIYNKTFIFKIPYKKVKIYILNKAENLAVVGSELARSWGIKMAQEYSAVSLFA